MKSSKKNISLLTYALDFGGAERVVSILLMELCKYHNVTLIVFYNHIIFEVPENVNVIVLGKLDETYKSSLMLQVKDFFRFSRTYKKVLKSSKIDVALSFLPFPNFINSLAKYSYPKLKTLISERGNVTNAAGKKSSYYISKLFYPLLYNKNDALYSNSIYINKMLKDKFKINIPMHVIYNPIILSDKHPKHTVNNTKMNFKVINIGGLNPMKNHSLLIKAIHKLHKENILLDIIGVGGLESELQNLIKRLKLNGTVKLLGNQINVYNFLTSSDCFVLSSNSEGFPNVLLEAMSVGLPVIASNCVSGPLELLNDNIPITIEKGEFYKAKYGILVNPNDATGFINAIIYLKNNADERQRYSVLGLNHVQNYNSVNIGKQVSTLINNL